MRRTDPSHPVVPGRRGLPARLGGVAVAALLALSCGARDELTASAGSVEHGADGGPGVDGGPGGQGRAIVSLVLGSEHACALRANGAAACWGSDGSGQLTGTWTSEMSAPYVLTPQPPPIAGEIAALGAGQDATAAVLRDGTLVYWGAAWMAYQSDPVSPTVLGSGFAGVSVGVGYGCGRRTDGTVACWGNWTPNDFAPSPTTVEGESGAAAVSACSELTCLLQEDASVRCWGYGAVGDGTDGEAFAPVAVQGLPAPARQIVVGGDHACALLEGGAVACWGHGNEGELGLGPGVTTALVPEIVPGLQARAISAGQYHTCAALTDGTVQCWGDLTEVNDPFTPQAVPGLVSVVRIASGTSFDCAVLAGGEVVCWGDNTVDQLGDGTTMNRSTPAPVVGLP